MIHRATIRTIHAQFTLPWDGIHGIAHWARVLENGLRMASINGARPEVVWLFAAFHDSRRENEDWDPEHGRRGAEFASSLRDSLFTITDEDFNLFRAACLTHSDGHTGGDITIQTCWDADRLDLGRVGIRPERIKLCTEAARDPQLFKWAYDRGVNCTIPGIVMNEWNLEDGS